MEKIIEKIAKKINYDKKYIETTLELLANENTVAFIARYRKHLTNGMDETEIKFIADSYAYEVKLQKRKEAIIENLKQKEMLTEELLLAINNAEKLVELENIYKPYSTNKKTKASIAIAKGLEPLANTILKNNKKINLLEEAQKYINPEKEVYDSSQALEGAQHIIAEKVANDLDIRNMFYKSITEYGKLTTKIKSKDKDIEKKYTLYYAFSKPIKFLQAYQIMAIDRAVNKGIITTKFEFNKEFIEQFTINKYTKKVEWEGSVYIKNAVIDGLKRLLIPSIENQVYSELCENASIKSADIFTKNLTSLLLQKPIANKVILGWDPGFVSGCKLAVINFNNEVLDIQTIYPVEPKKQIEKSENIILELIKKYNIDIIAIGNGTASWESANFVSNLIKKYNLSINYIIVSEAGASVYSASKKGIEEFPNLSVEQRSAISIARRIIDPLSELIKIEPQSIGVGQYQHDIKEKVLKEKVDFATSICVNKVGVNVNTASIELLNNISGINAKISKKIIEYIKTNQKINNRQELLKIPYLSQKVFEQAAGFLRVENSDNFFDKTSIHPEMYDDAQKIMNFLNISQEDIENKKINIDKEKIQNISQKLNIDIFKTNLIIENLNNPLRDYREDFDDPILRNEILDLNNVAIGAKFLGTVRNITDFGAFIDIGLKNDVFLHVSKLNNQNIFDALNINDILNVEIDEINKENNNISVKVS